MAIFLASAACSRSPTPGSDAPPNDASAEASREVGIEAGVDTGVSTNDATGGYGPFVGTWTAFPGVPDCGTLVAANPASSVGPLRWTTCASGRAGCRELVVDWGSGDRRLEVGYPEPVRPAVAAAPALLFLRVYNDPAAPKDPKYSVTAVQPVADGAMPLIAIGDDHTYGKVPAPCGYELSFGRHGLVAEKTETTGGGARTVFWRAWSAATLESVTLPYSKLLSVPVGDTAFSSVTSDALHIETDTPRGIAVFDFASREIKTSAAPAIPLELPRAVAGGTVARMIGPPWGLYFVSDAGSSSQILTTAAGRAVLAHAIDRARGEDLVWAEGTSDFKAILLWESPLAKTAAELRPRKIGTFSPWWGVVVANAGMVLASVDGASAVLIRRSDGARWTLATEPGRVFKSAVWVDETEVWLTTAASGVAGAGPSGMIRLRRDALPAPDGGL